MQNEHPLYTVKVSHILSKEFSFALFPSRDPSIPAQGLDTSPHFGTGCSQLYQQQHYLAKAGATLPSSLRGANQLQRAYVLLPGCTRRYTRLSCTRSYRSTLR